MSIITISRQTGSYGDEIAAELSRKLGYELITRQEILSRFFSGVAGPYELRLLSESVKFYLTDCGKNMTYLDYIKGALKEYAADHSFVMVGFGGQAIFSGDINALHIRVIASHDLRVARIKKQYRISDSEAKDILLTSDKKHKKFVSALFGIDLTDAAHYDLTLNSGSLSVYECVNSVSTLIRERDLFRKTERINVISNTTDRPVLKNESESDFARILDMYQIDWKYEPKTFPIEWDAEGNVTLAFSPDFYLTDFDTYIELTTMNQKYITTKNKKLKKLKELYPGTNIRIVNRKDFLSLIERFRPLRQGDMQ